MGNTRKNRRNKELAKAFGESIGKMADEMDVSGWYAPAMNTHRSAFAGQNFEYYSEIQGAAERQLLFSSLVILRFLC